MAVTHATEWTRHESTESWDYRPVDGLRRRPSQSDRALRRERHLFGLHEGRIRLYGPASHMRWRFGRTPILEVHGREKRVLA